MSFFPHLPRVELELPGAPRGTEIVLAAGFLPRLRGLMFAAPLAPRRGMLIMPCNSIHALFMRARFEAVFLSRDFRVLKIATPLRPWLGWSVCPGAHAVLEWRVGEAASLGVQEGMRLKWARLPGDGEAARDGEGAA
jgi:uncharacterized membrane protein (UPF0127 family)